MGMSTHVRRGHPITFGLLIFFGIIELALSAWLTSKFNMLHNERNTTERDRVRFTLFTSTWTLLFSGLLLVLFWHSADGSILTSVLSHLVILSFTWIMWTAVVSAVTVMLGGGLNCNHEDAYVYCNQLNALEGFAWVEWVLVTFALIIVLIRGVSAARRGDGYRGSLV
ncbi:Aldehyde dehydrogenase [Mycena sanguinolenta]|uniref:Aldehyde dehydrogenase n=1 Tax=Mycena sanguinolenta TaxID=230812 RepID=A0A8H6WP36_9AGAR|nr:Aldehyde dehydrogenase [Mycena sanguinolenta]